MIREHARAAMAHSRRRDAGQGMVEYALVIILVAAVAALGFGTFGTMVNALVAAISL